MLDLKKLNYNHYNNKAYSYHKLTWNVVENCLLTYFFISSYCPLGVQQKTQAKNIFHFSLVTSQINSPVWGSFLFSMEGILEEEEVKLCISYPTPSVALAFHIDPPGFVEEPTGAVCTAHASPLQHLLLGHPESLHCALNELATYGIIPSYFQKGPVRKNSLLPSGWNLLLAGCHFLITENILLFSCTLCNYMVLLLYGGDSCEMLALWGGVQNIVSCWKQVCAIVFWLGF